ncbi:hypothetical protein SETIT_2G154000v2 [Setaria italica]|uniref:Uncharacterized protein n=1 Tax=Setaria italica TaxID=4555 RepID=A0A368PZI3_SETIT|nr:hypothetical protein SETIT_2G154000v2 [Setaria italica]
MDKIRVRATQGKKGEPRVIPCLVAAGKNLVVAGEDLVGTGKDLVGAGEERSWAARRCGRSGLTGAGRAVASGSRRRTCEWQRRGAGGRPASGGIGEEEPAAESREAEERWVASGVPRVASRRSAPRPGCRGPVILPVAYRLPWPNGDGKKCNVKESHDCSIFTRWRAPPLDLAGHGGHGGRCAWTSPSLAVPSLAVELGPPTMEGTASRPHPHRPWRRHPRTSPPPPPGPWCAPRPDLASPGCGELAPPAMGTERGALGSSRSGGEELNPASGHRRGRAQVRPTLSSLAHVKTEEGGKPRAVERHRQRWDTGVGRIARGSRAWQRDEGHSGEPGTRGGLALRVSQFVCADGSLAAMGSAYGFSNYSAFCKITLVPRLVVGSSWLLGGSSKCYRCNTSKVSTRAGRKRHKPDC